jgi:hypothetical protein
MRAFEQTRRGFEAELGVSCNYCRPGLAGEQARKIRFLKDRKYLNVVLYGRILLCTL